MGNRIDLNEAQLKKTIYNMVLESLDEGWKMALPSWCDLSGVGVASNDNPSAVGAVCNGNVADIYTLQDFFWQDFQDKHPQPPTMSDEEYGRLFSDYLKKNTDEVKSYIETYGSPVEMDETCHTKAQKRANLIKESMIHVVEEELANDIVECLETGIGRYEFDFVYDLGEGDAIEGIVEVGLTEDEDGTIWAYDIAPNLWTNYKEYKTREPYECNMDALKQELAERGIHTQD
ncbi:MAG: hypothetical protein LUD72_04345 [Bacteroidales bacterium]|nr:hypothetical protein [Bacteroidales bacterium]